jgi:hypothetical protein
MDSRERLFLGKQDVALFRLIPDVLCKLIVLCEGRAQRIQRGVQAFLSLAEIPQLIAEQSFAGRIPGNAGKTGCTSRGVDKPDKAESQLSQSKANSYGITRGAAYFRKGGDR